MRYPRFTYKEPQSYTTDIEAAKSLITGLPRIYEKEEALKTEKAT